MFNTISGSIINGAFDKEQRLRTRIYRSGESGASFLPSGPSCGIFRDADSGCFLHETAGGPINGTCSRDHLYRHTRALNMQKASKIPPTFGIMDCPF
jgi:hypothetical protein